MKLPRDRGEAVQARRRKAAIALCSCAVLVVTVTQSIRGADEAAQNPAPLLKQYCFQCHSGASPMAGLNLEQLSTQPVGGGFQHWEKVAAALEATGCRRRACRCRQKRSAATWSRGFGRS